MATITLEQLLGSVTVTRAISRLKTPMMRFQNFWNMQPGGSANNPVGGRNTAWDIFDNTRHIATGRAFGVGPANRAPQVIGQVNARLYRAHEKVWLDESRLFRTRPLGGNFGDVDQRGQAYVTKQEAHLSQGFTNNREFMISRMMRGQFQLKNKGDDWLPVDTDGQMTIDFQIPPGNKDQLNMTGTGDLIDVLWSDTANADIPGQCLNINAAFEELHGYPLRHVWVNARVINLVMNNTAMREGAGTANIVFERFQPTGMQNVEGIEDTGFNVVFSVLPWLTFHVYDAGLLIEGKFVKFLENDKAIFTPNPDPLIAEYHEGSEIVAENVMSPGDERMGMSAWTTRVIDPAGFDLKGLDIGLPALQIPKAIAYATVA